MYAALEPKTNDEYTEILMVHKRNSIQTFSTRRVEMLTDGVFAIAMTILVLDLKVIDLGGRV